MKRKKGQLVPLEAEILNAGLALHARGIVEFYGYLLATEIRGERQATDLIAYGSLYKALDRLENRGFLQRRWEDPDEALAEKRPRRRLYRVTLAGQRALDAWNRALLEAGQAPRLGAAQG